MKSILSPAWPALALALALTPLAGPAAADDLLPPGAKPGECYARVYTPPVYETETVSMLKKEAGQRVEIVPARYETVEQTVVVKEASSRLEVVPATYETVTERVMVEPEKTALVEVPAEYGWDEERVLVKAAHTVWKKGRGPIEKLDDGTGEIMCLVEVPAEYKTVRKRVLVQAARTEEQVTPAVYETVERRVQKTAPTTRTIEIPAETATVSVRKLVEPARTETIEIPAEYQNVTQRKMVREGSLAWRSILCETNMSAGVVLELQRALSGAGYDPGPLDGTYGRQTADAVDAYQRSKGLATGQLTMETLTALGLSPNIGG